MDTSIKQFRDKHGLTQQDFAEIFGACTNSVHRWETGLHPAPVAVLLLIELVEQTGEWPESTGMNYPILSDG